MLVFRNKDLTTKKIQKFHFVLIDTYHEPVKFFFELCYGYSYIQVIHLLMLFGTSIDLAYGYLTVRSREV